MTGVRWPAWAYTSQVVHLPGRAREAWLLLRLINSYLFLVASLLLLVRHLLLVAMHLFLVAY